MVAYSFQARFEAPILSGVKRQTIRLNRRGRSRHARPGELVQLYVGMRTSSCRKIRPDVVCEGVFDVAFVFCRDDPDEASVLIDGRAVPPAERDAFARADGFADFADMSAFWLREHGEAPFYGVLITWGEMT